MKYELYYWPGIQGRGELVRLVLEDAGAAYIDVAREDGGMAKLKAAMTGTVLAPPFLHAGKLVVGQTVNIMRFVAERHGLAPKSVQGQLAASTIALTIADLINEVHDTHHPLTVEQAYETQKDAAAVRAKAFREGRIGKFTAYLEKILTDNGKFLVGRSISYADLAAFQVVEGLSYAFPNAMSHHKLPKLRALRDAVAKRPRLAAYLASPRRLPFNQHGIFRHYPELDS